MTRRRNKQGGGRREHAATQRRPCNGNLPADASEEDDREMGKAAQVMPSSNQFVQTCCLLCHRERKDWVGSLPHNGLMSPVGEIPASFMPSLAQNLLGEMPLWICQTCRKSVEEEERRVSLSHTTCKSQSCGGGSHSSSSSSSSTSCSSPSSLTCHGNSGDWDPSSFLSAHKLSGLWNSTNVNSIGGSTDGTSINPTSRNLCKSSKQVKGCCQSQGSTGEGCHSSEHHRLCDLGAPQNSPTGVSSRQNPPLNPASSKTFSPTLSPCTKSSNSTSISPSRAHRGPHVVSSSPSLLNVNTPPPPLSCSHSCNGNCSGGSGLPPGCTTGTTVNRDAACKGHKHTNITCDDEDEDSGSEQSSCTSSSTNQKEGKFCDCCYCEFFGQSTPPPAPTSRNYAEMREKLRIRLTKRKEEPNAKPLTPGEQTVDNRDVNELLDFINSNDAKTMTPSNSTSINSSKAAKRARYKLKKREKVLHEVNAQKAQDEYVAIEDMCASASDEALLQWPPLELEQVNSFLTSRLEEIKNTIKDSIRASFSVYDLNLDVNDFPKKAAMLEQKNLLSHSHLNGSSDLPEIDLDLSPLNLGYSKTNAKTPEDTEGATIQPVENGVVKRLSAVPTLSRMIWVQSAKVPVSELNSDLKKAGIVPNERNLTVSERQGSPDPPLAVSPTVLQSAVHPAVASRQRKPRKQYLQVQKRELFSVETVVGKLPSAGSMADDQKLRHLPEMDEVPSEHGSSILIASLPKSAEASGQDMCQRTGGGVETVTYKDICESPQPRKKGKLDDEDQCYITMTIDEIFLPKDVDYVDMDEVDREVECFKRFCLESAKQTRQKLVVDWTNFSLKKFLHGGAHAISPLLFYTLTDTLH